MADIGFNSVFGIEGGTPGTYVTVADVRAITIPGFMRESVESTHLTSANQYKQYIPGMKDMTEASLVLNWTPSHTDVLITAFEAESGNYQITAPNGVRIQFSGFFTEYTPPELTPGGLMEATVTVRPTGKATYVAAA